MLPHFVPSDAFQHTRIAGKLSKKYKNVDTVMNPNVKGMGHGNDVICARSPSLQYKDPIKD